MKVNKFDRENISWLSVEFLKEMREVAAKFGLTVKQDKGSFTDYKYNIRFNVLAEAVDGTSAEVQEFNQLCIFYGLKPEHYGKEFSFFSGNSTTVYKLVGIKPRRTRYPLVGRNIMTGKDMLFTTSILGQIRGVDSCPEVKLENY